MIVKLLAVQKQGGDRGKKRQSKGISTSSGLSLVIKQAVRPSDRGSSKCGCSNSESKRSYTSLSQLI